MWGLPFADPRHAGSGRPRVRTRLRRLPALSNLGSVAAHRRFEGSCMKGHAKVLEILNDLLTNELTSVNQYFVHAKMCANWGYQRLSSKVREESIDEMKHADRLISRILYLDGVPNLQKLNKVNVGQTVDEQLRLDLDL